MKASIMHSLYTPVEQRFHQWSGSENSCGGVSQLYMVFKVSSLPALLQGL